MSVKIWFRNGAAGLLYRVGLTAPTWRGRGRLTIVTFHRVLSEAERRAYPYPGLVVTPTELDALLHFFTDHFDCGSLAVQHKRYLSGDISVRPLLALTFDDAPHDNYRNARPMLARHQVKATFFAPVVAVERQEYLWPDRLGFAILALMRQGQGGREQVMRILTAAGLPAAGACRLVESVVQDSKKLPREARLRLVEALVEASGRIRWPEFARPMTLDELAELAGEGHEIGSHSMTHCMMPECDDRELGYELSESRHILQSRLAQPIESFCYPNGDYDVRTAKAVAEAGYRRAVTTGWGHNDQRTDPFRLCRFDMDVTRVCDSNGNLLPAVLALRMSGLYPGLG